MSDLLLMASPGLPLNGLVGLWDPYRDTYGRNVSVTTTALMPKEALTESSGTFLETEATAYHTCKPSGGNFLPPLWFSAVFTPIGRKRFMIGRASVNSWAIVDTSTVAVVATGLGASGATIAANGDGSFTLSVHLENGSLNSGWLYTLPDDATVPSSASFAGDTSKGFTLHQWQVNLGSVLYPYSAPSGEPGTLQTSLDYSGNGNHLTLGATTGASTDDPAFTGTAWSFDGGDYLLAPDLGAGDITAYIVFKTAASMSVALSGLLARNNIALYYGIATDKAVLQFRDASGSSKAVSTPETLSKNTWYLLTARASSAGLWSISTAGSGSLVASGWTLKADSTVYGKLVGKWASGAFEGLIAYTALYNWVHPDALATRCRNSIKSLMAPRGIAL